MTEEQATEVTASSDSLIDDKPATPALDFSKGERPESFPEEFWNAEAKAPDVEKLFKEFNTQKSRADGLRVKLSKGEFDGKAPEDIKEYVVELSDELKPLVPEDDPIFNAARSAAKNAGIPKETFSKFIAPIVSELAKHKAEAEKPISPEEKEARRSEELAKLGPNGGRIVDAVGSFIQQLKAGGTLTEAEAEVAKDMVFNAESARVFNKLRLMSGDRDQVPIDVPVDAKSSRAEVELKMAQAMMANNEAEYTKYSNMLARMN